MYLATAKFEAGCFCPDLIHLLEDFIYSHGLESYTNLKSPSLHHSCILKHKYYGTINRVPRDGKFQHFGGGREV
jgi:hypothetical protein